MPLEGRRFRRRKKEDLFVEGYFIDHANVLTPGVNQTDETFHLYGKDSPETDVQVNYGTLVIGVLDKYTNNQILDLITWQDPTVSPHQYRVDDLQSVHVWMNVKNQKSTSYVKSIFYPGWSPGMPLPSGNPEAKAEVQITGNSKLPRQFQGLFITMKKMASGGAMSLGATPVVVPNEANIYAIAVKAIDDSAVYDQEEMPVSAAMVTSTGDVSAAEITSLLTNLTSWTHAAVYFLQSGAGVYPAAYPISPNKLRA